MLSYPSLYGLNVLDIVFYSVIFIQIYCWEFSCHTMNCYQTVGIKVKTIDLSEVITVCRVFITKRFSNLLHNLIRSN